jgi:hypothetical protein
MCLCLKFFYDTIFGNTVNTERNRLIAFNVRPINDNLHGYIDDDRFYVVHVDENENEHEYEIIFIQSDEEFTQLNRIMVVIYHNTWYMRH